MKRFAGFTILFLFSTGGTNAQFRPVDPANTHYRVLAIVPLMGSGTKENPKKPLLTDLPGIVAWKAELSDNKQFALVELVAKDRRVLEAAFANPALVQARAGNASVQIEHKDQGRAPNVYAEFARLRRGFRPERFGVAVH